MKRILLTSTALVAFAGAAAAEISFSGSFKAGYNDEHKNGAYWSAGLKVMGSKELDGGLTAGFSTNIELADGASAFTLNNGTVQFKDYEFYLKSDVAGLYIGDTKTATEVKWSAGVSGLAANDFAKRGEASGELAVIRAESKLAGVDAALSTGVRTKVGGGTELKGYQFAAKYSVSSFNFGLAVQDASSFGGQTAGVKVGGTFAGADVSVAYVRNGSTKATSAGVQVAYPFGPVKVTAYYADNSAAADRYGVKLAYSAGAIKVTGKVDGYAKYGTTAAYTKIAVDGSYDMGNGLKLMAGLSSNSNTKYQTGYVGGKYDLGGGASLLASYGWDNDDTGAANDEIGSPEFYEGTTVEVSFKF